MYLYSPVGGGRIGERVGTTAGFGDPSGTLPYTPKAAAMAPITVADGSTQPVSAAVGVGQDGTSHVTFFAVGKVSADYVITTDWADATGLVALYDQGRKQITVLAFHRSGGVTRLVIGGVAPGTKPTAGPPTTVLGAGSGGFTAATFARFDGDAAGTVASLWAYAVSGDSLVLVKAPAAGAGTMETLVGSGLTGTRHLGRLATGTVGAGGVAAWPATGVGRLYYGAKAFGPLSYAGPALALPR